MSFPEAPAHAVARALLKRTRRMPCLGVRLRSRSFHALTLISRDAFSIEDEPVAGALASWREGMVSLFSGAIDLSEITITFVSPVRPRQCHAPARAADGAAFRALERDLLRFIEAAAGEAAGRRFLIEHEAEPGAGPTHTRFLLARSVVREASMANHSWATKAAPWLAGIRRIAIYGQTCKLSAHQRLALASDGETP